MFTFWMGLPHQLRQSRQLFTNRLTGQHNLDNPSLRLPLQLSTDSAKLISKTDYHIKEITYSVGSPSIHKCGLSCFQKYEIYVIF